MNKTRKTGASRAFLLTVVAGGLLTASCEDHVSVGEKNVTNVYNGQTATGSTGTSASSSRTSSSSTAGNWAGKSATGQVSSKLSLSESGGSISGLLQWPNDRRSVSGTHSGGSVTLHIGGGDTWKLSYNGSSLSGTGYKAGGGTYSVSFTRR